MAQRGKNKGIRSREIMGGLPPEARSFLMGITTVGLLKSMIDCSLSEGLAMTKGRLRSLYSFIKLFTPQDFEENNEKRVCVVMLHHILNARVVQCVSSIPHVKHMLKTLGGRHDADIADILFGVREVSDGEIASTVDMAAVLLNYASLTGHMGKISDLSIKLLARDCESIGELLRGEVIPAIYEAAAAVRKTEQVGGHSTHDFDSSIEGLSGIFTSLYDFEKNKGSAMSTGLQALDKMLGGRGFEAGTVTLFLGLTGGWKSGLLLNCTSWFNRYNNDCGCFDRSKVPCCMYYSLENDMFMTAKRWFAIRIGRSDDIIRRYANGDEVAAAIYEDIFAESQGRCHVDWRYRRPREYCANDIAADIEAMAERGYECKMLVLDYVKRLKPNDPTANVDERTRLGMIGDDLSVLAKTYKMAVVTAQQVNREGMKAIEAANEMKKQDLAKFISASHAANSWDLVENMDMAIAMQLEDRPVDGILTRVLSMKRVKCRREQPGAVFFAHPFVDGRQMLLVEDAGRQRSASLEVLDSEGQLRASNDSRAEEAKKTKVVDPRRASRKAMLQHNKDRRSGGDGGDDDEGLLNSGDDEE